MYVCFNFIHMYTGAVGQYVMHWLIRHEAWVQTPGRTSSTKRYMQTYFFGDLRSADF